MKTLSESGYPGRHYIHNSMDVCFVWYSRSVRTGRVCQDLAWTAFSWTRGTGKLVSQKGYLVPARVPSRHYSRSLEALREEALKAPALFRLGKFKEWVGPYLYSQPGTKPVVGQEGLAYALLETEPAHSAGKSLSYRITENFEPALCIGA